MSESSRIQHGRIYTGEVVHKRLRPKTHVLKYRVFSLLLDIDRLDENSRRLRLFSHNRWNVFSFFEQDHGPGTSENLAVHIRDVFAKSGIDAGQDSQILLLAYPRMFGYAFNPLSVYYAISTGGELQGVIYEVNNTWGERRSYVVKAGESHNGVFAQNAAKEMFVSPFAQAHGRYGFRVTLPGDTLTVGVQFHDPKGALIRTHFAGAAEPLTDRTLAGLLVRYPMMTLKVIIGIHYEALKLWLKGVPLERGESTRRYTITHVGLRTSGLNDATQ